MRLFRAPRGMARQPGRGDGGLPAHGSPRTWSWRRPGRRHPRRRVRQRRARRGVAGRLARPPPGVETVTVESRPKVEQRAPARGGRRRAAAVAARGGSRAATAAARRRPPRAGASRPWAGSRPSRSRPRGGRASRPATPRRARRCRTRRRGWRRPGSSARTTSAATVSREAAVAASRLPSHSSGARKSLTGGGSFGREASTSPPRNCSRPAPFPPSRRASARSRPRGLT